MSATPPRGPHGGPLCPSEGGSVEPLSPELCQALLASQGAPRALPVELDPAAARLIAYDLDASVGARFHAPAHELRPWEPATLPRPATLAALAAVGRSLAALHARGVAHGDLRPDTLRLDATGAPALLVASRESRPGAAMRARLHPGGEDPASLGFAPPEVLAGVEATPASDVYALAALVYAATTGYAPVGQLNLRPYATDADGALAQRLEAALNQSPRLRPPMAALIDALAFAATASAATGAARPYRDPAQFGFDPSAPQAVRAEISPVLMLVLIVGGMCAFLGAVLLVVAGWDVVGEYGRVALLAGLTALSLGAGQLASSRGLSTGAAVARALAGLFGVVAVGYSFYLLNEPGRLGLLLGLCALSFAGGALARRRRAPVAGSALLTLGSQLGWAVGAQAIHMTRPSDALGATCVVAGAVSAVTYGLAVRERSLAIGLLGALDLVVFCGTLGSWLDRGTVFGAATYALACAAGALLLARLATALGGRDAASPYAGGAAVAGALSVLAALALLNREWVDHGYAAAAWPYLVAVLALAGSRLAPPAGGSARFVALGTLAAVPTLQAMIRDELGFTVVAVAGGFAFILASVFASALRERNEARTELIFAGLVGVAAAPDLRVLHAIESLGRQGDPSAFGAWITMAAASLGLLSLSYTLTGRVRRGQHRALEIVGLGQLFALLTLRVLADTRDPLPAAAALGGAALATALGAGTRRLWVMLLGATTLGVHAWIQYFARLEGVFPLSVRLVGFGVGLLLGGVIYEQKLRGRLAALREWS